MEMSDDKGCKPIDLPMMRSTRVTFPEDPAEQARVKAAWDAFADKCDPSRAAWRKLKGEIVHAVKAGHTSRAALAAYLGSDRKTVSAATAELQQEGLLVKEGARWAIPGATREQRVRVVAAMMRLGEPQTTTEIAREADLPTARVGEHLRFMAEFCDVEKKGKRWILHERKLDATFRKDAAKLAKAVTRG